MTKYVILTLVFFLLSVASSDAGTQRSSLVFAANVDGNWDLFMVEEDGSNLLRLTSTPYDEKDPSWSPDYKEIVYATSDGGLNIINVKTKEHRQLDIEVKTNPKTSPSFSPDGKSIAFVESIAATTDDTHLKIFNLERKINKKVLVQYGPQFWPVWSPDGRRIVYGSAHCSVDCGRIIQELWITDANGGYARQLLMTNSLCQQPDWSRDGKRIAFASDKNGNLDIWILSLEDWKLEQITHDTSLDASPAWSPEGDKLAFISTRSGRMEIWIKELETGVLERLRPFGDRDVECKDVAW
jgi:TolB protein